MCEWSGGLPFAISVSKAQNPNDGEISFVYSIGSGAMWKFEGFLRRGSGAERIFKDIE